MENINNDLRQAKPSDLQEGKIIYDSNGDQFKLKLNWPDGWYGISIDGKTKKEIFETNIQYYKIKNTI